MSISVHMLGAPTSGNEAQRASIVGRCTYIQVIYVYLWEQYFFRLKKYITKKGYRINHYINVWLKSECQLSDHNGDLSSQYANGFVFLLWSMKKEERENCPWTKFSWDLVQDSLQCRTPARRQAKVWWSTWWIFVVFHPWTRSVLLHVILA